MGRSAHGARHPRSGRGDDPLDQRDRKLGRDTASLQGRQVPACLACGGDLVRTALGVASACTSCGLRHEALGRPGGWQVRAIEAGPTGRRRFARAGVAA